MTILGVDPGTNTTGYGIIGRDGSRPCHVASGVIHPTRAASPSRRLLEIHEGLAAVITGHRPSVMVVESLFHGQNSQSLMKLSQVRGVILLLGETYGMEIFEYSPMEIKMGLTGYGKADKRQMVYMVSRVLALPNLKSADEADALAMAVYHYHRSGFNRMAS
jgi:crossover junction endodeoxyribonuclease RuvC